MPAGMPKVEISFLIDADGILIVKAKELRSGIEQSIEVKPQYGLTDQAVEQMLFESISHAKEDMQQRALVEAQTEGKILADTTKVFIEKHKKHLFPEELSSTDKALHHLNEMIKSGSKDEVRAAIEVLNEITRPFAERMMDIKIKEALVNKQIT
jgi:molecular chaperone HscA